MIGQDDLLSPELPSSPIGNELAGGLGVSSLTSPRGKVPLVMSHHSCTIKFVSIYRSTKQD